MSRTFLELCKDIVADLGVAGGVLQSTQGLTQQELIRVCGWVARADLYLQNLWTQWNFLWVNDAAVSAQAGTDFCITSPPAWAANIQSYDLDSLWINAGTAAAQRVVHMDWNNFYLMYQVLPKATRAVPNFFSVDPSGKIWLSEFVSANTTFSLSYYVVGKRMQADGDTSPIPANFDTIITERAKIIYAGREDAPEILVSASAEYTEQLDKMQAYCLPGNLGGRTLRSNATIIPEAYVE